MRKIPKGSGLEYKDSKARFKLELWLTRHTVYPSNIYVIILEDYKFALGIRYKYRFLCAIVDYKFIENEARYNRWRGRIAKILNNLRKDIRAGRTGF